MAYKKSGAAAAPKRAARKNFPERNLLIVESPSKARTIGKYLGSSYTVLSSVGHVRDLPRSRLAIDIEHNFEPEYINVRGKAPVINELKNAAEAAKKGGKKILLATDPDREGEAIAWHVANLLDLPAGEPWRVTFNEITKDCIKDEVKNPRRLEQNLVDAQQARRVLDRLVGYQISPLLWRKIRSGLSAGRVQSAALKIICDRQKEIDNFVAEEYWTIEMLLAKTDGVGQFVAKLDKIDGVKAALKNEADAGSVAARLKAATLSVAGVEEKQRMRKPYAPYTTSTLQQDASVRLGFSPRSTMAVAQSLYEGVKVGSETAGLITYMRTDSVRISAAADAAAKDLIRSQIGEQYVGNNVFSNKRKEVQDAHEAIRPTNVTRTPEMVKEYLSADQFKLYDLIWRRFVASRMAAAVYDTATVGLVAKDSAGEMTLRASGSRLVFDGFLRVYKAEEKAKKEKEASKLATGGELPKLAAGENCRAEKIEPSQHFTKPPAQFNDASLVKKLEELEIGRPSTYVSIIETLVTRRYVNREAKVLRPTALGFSVDTLMNQYFEQIVDASFTAKIEEKFDDIEARGEPWQQIIGQFYDGFAKELAVAEKEIEALEPQVEQTDEVCEKCGQPMVIRHGRFGKFLACSNYPECKNAKPIVKKVGAKCPKCGSDIVEKRSRRGKIFYSCSGYPECKKAYWERPIDIRCPDCGDLMTIKKTKNGDLVCGNADCKRIGVFAEMAPPGMKVEGLLTDD